MLCLSKFSFFMRRLHGGYTVGHAPLPPQSSVTMVTFHKPFCHKRFPFQTITSAQSAQGRCGLSTCFAQHIVWLCKAILLMVTIPLMHRRACALLICPHGVTCCTALVHRQGLVSAGGMGSRGERRSCPLQHAPRTQRPNVSHVPPCATTACGLPSFLILKYHSRMLDNSPEISYTCTRVPQGHGVMVTRGSPKPLLRVRVLLPLPQWVALIRSGGSLFVYQSRVRFPPRHAAPLRGCRIHDGTAQRVFTSPDRFRLQKHPDVHPSRRSSECIPPFPRQSAKTARKFFPKPLTSRGSYIMIYQFRAVYCGKNLLTHFPCERKATALRTAGSTAECGQRRTFDCAKARNFMSWLLNSQLVTS